MTTLHLPTEIWRMIFEYINEKEDLQSLMAVNKQFYDLTIPFLYKRVEIETHCQLDLFLKVLKEKPFYSEYIETLSLDNIDFSETEKADLKTLCFLMNTKMPKLKSLLLIESSLNDYARNFKFNDRLVELELSFESARLFSYQKGPFPKLKSLKISGPFFFKREYLHQFGFPYIEKQTFNSYMGDINFYYSFMENIIRNFNEDVNFDFLLSTNEKKLTINFPQLKKIQFKDTDIEMYAEELEDPEYFVYMLIIAIIGLPSLREISVNCKYFNTDYLILEKVLSKRPPDFRFNEYYEDEDNDSLDYYTEHDYDDDYSFRSD